MHLTPAELTVLGLIAEQPRHGYDLERVIEERGIRQWADIGFSSIYYVLSKLEQRGLIEAEQGAGAKSRRVFRTTSEGRRAAAAEAVTFIADARAAPLPVLVGIANLALLTEHDYIGALRSRLALLDERIAAVERAAEAQAPLSLSAREVFSFALAMLRAERAWLVERVDRDGYDPLTDEGRS